MSSHDDFLAVKRLHRVFRENEHQICRFFHEELITTYSEHMADLDQLRYLEIAEADAETHVELMLKAIKPGQLKGLSIDLPDNDEKEILDKTIDLIQRYRDTLYGLNTLYLYVPVELNLNVLLEALPDLEYLYVYGSDLDVSMIRHASLRHLISDDAQPIQGLETCSFPNLEYLEIDRANSLFFEQLPELRLRKLAHLGILGGVPDSDDEDINDVILNATFPESIRSLRLDGFPQSLEGDVLIKNEVSRRLTHLTFYDTEVGTSGIITKENFPLLQHLGIVQEPENGGSQAADALDILSSRDLPPNLMSLDLQGTPMGDNELGQLLSLPVVKQLKYLNINFHTADDEELLAQFKALDAEVHMARAETGGDDEDDDEDDYE